VGAEVIDPKGLVGLSELLHDALVYKATVLHGLGVRMSGTCLEEPGEVTGPVEDGEGGMARMQQVTRCGQQMIQNGGRGDVGGDGENSTQQLPEPTLGTEHLSGTVDQFLDRAVQLQARGIRETQQVGYVVGRAGFRSG
jgi:hypothetical protein